MLNDNSAAEREETPHTANSNQKRTVKVHQTISVALKRRAQSVIKDRSIDAQSRAVIRYGLETNDPWLAELVRRADAGETIIDTVDFSETAVLTGTDSSTERITDEEKIELLVDLVCRAGDEPATKSAALLVLLASLEASAHPTSLTSTAKYLAFIRCAELNVCGIVDTQIDALAAELFADNTVAA